MPSAACVRVRVRVRAYVRADVRVDRVNTFILRVAYVCVDSRGP